MSNIMKFRPRTKPTPTPEIEVVKPREIFWNYYEKYHPDDAKFKLGYDYLRKHDWSESFLKYPEKPISACYTKNEILRMQFPITHLAVAAVFAKDVLQEEEVSNILLEMFEKYLSRNVIEFNLACIPPVLVGYLIFIGEDIRRIPKIGVHPAGSLLLQYGMIFSCWKN